MSRSLNLRRRGRTLWRLLRSDGTLIAGVVMIVLVVFGAVIATKLFGLDGDARKLTPDVLAGPRSGHIVGTDSLGRDLLARSLVAMRSSLFIALVTVALTMIAGTAIGLITSYRGGATDWIAMRIVDLALGIPALLMAMSLLASIGPSAKALVYVMLFALLPQVIRVVRSSTLEVRTRDFVASARLSGVSTPRILVRHLLPNIRSTVIVQTSVTASLVMLLEAALSFLGLGVPPPSPSLGSMVSESRQWMQIAPWTLAAPSAAIVLAVTAFSLLGTGLDRALSRRS